MIGLGLYRSADN